MLRLFFGQKASKRDNISVDLLLGYRSRFAVFQRHAWKLDIEDDFLYLGQIWLGGR